MAERKAGAAQAARRAREELAALTGREPESVLAVERDRDGDGDGKGNGKADGWRVTLELLELRRVPNTTDLLGCYEVTLDGSGDLLGYRRTGRYLRGQPDGEGA
jgi:hypothetical protein